jgi:hypothetical protein
MGEMVMKIVMKFKPPEPFHASDAPVGTFLERNGFVMGNIFVRTAVGVQSLDGMFFIPNGALNCIDFSPLPLGTVIEITV